MKVCEIFTSIQGESSYAGLPCTFVRLAGCNLRCCYCDTQYAFDGGVEMSSEEVIDRVSDAGIPLVELTGGEPLMQESVANRLIGMLLDQGYRVLLETNGSFSIKQIDLRAIVILDVKTPGSGMEQEMDYSNFGYLKSSDEVKFVICSREDYEWAKQTIAEHRLSERCSVLFSPVSGLIEPAALVRWIVKDRLQVRFNLQLHKYIFGAEERGV